MGPKRPKSSQSNAGVAPHGRNWESGLISTPLEEDTWKVSIAFVVENRQEDEVHTKALSQAVSAPMRRLFSLVSWESTLQQIHELGNSKIKKTKDSPSFSEVTEAAKALLDRGGDLPLPLIAKLLKFQFLRIKQKDLQRRDAINKPKEEKTKKKSAKAKPPSAKSPGKGNKAPEAPPPIKKETTLRRRGEDEDTKYIDDEPDDGVHHYIIVLGFYQPQLLALLADLGVHVASVIRISSQSYASLPADQGDLSLAPEVLEAGKQRKATLAKSLEVFWKYLEPILESGKPGSSLLEVARLQCLVKESDYPPDWGNSDMQLAFASEVFENVACLMYDTLDWRRQHRHYLSSLQLVKVPLVSRDKVPAAQPPPPETRETDAAPQTPSSKKKTQPDDVHPTFSLPPETSPPDEAEAAGLSADVDMNYYNDLLSDVPDELASVPLILHCVLEQVVATERDLAPPSEAEPEPRADGLDPAVADHLLSVLDSLSLSEKEKKNLYNTFLFQDKEEKEAQSKGPLQMSCHDKTRQRMFQAQVPKSLDLIKIEREMLQKLPLSELLRFTQPSPEGNSQRLAQIHELMHYCAADPLSREDVGRAFRMFTFESLKLTGLDESGYLECTGKMLAGDPAIPWDNPASFARQMWRSASVRRMREQRERCTAGTGNEEDSQSEGVLPAENKETDLADIQRTRRRSLSDWCYSERYEPDLLLQVLHDAAQSYQCMDSYYLAQDNSLLLALHSPMDSFRQSQDAWDMALHSDVSFRNYLELVADSISDWVQKEEEKYQEEKIQKELKPTQNDARPGAASPRGKKGKKAASPKKSKSPKGSRSRPGSKAEEEAPEPARDPFIREDSLKAWKEERDRLQEEERLREEKRNAKSGKSKAKRRKGSSERAESRESKRSPQGRGTSAKDRKKPEEPQEPAGDTSVLPTAAPQEVFKQFIGYDTGDDLIQVSGSSRSLYPADGGQIRAEHLRFQKGSSFVKMNLLKDGHSFLIHITNPYRPRGEEEQQEKAATERSGVSEFGSFVAALAGGIRFSLSHYGPSGKGPEHKDPELAAMLSIPSVQTPSIVPAPPPHPPATPSGKSRKSPRQKSPKASRVKSPRSAPREESPGPEEAKVEPAEPPLPPAPNPVPAAPAFQSLNVSCPNGLLLAFLRDDSAGELRRQVTPRDNLLIRQSYPGRVRSGRLCKCPGSQAVPEASRVVTARGTVVKYMLDGSTQVLFPDGSVSRSPDSGPVVRLQPPSPSPAEASDETSRDPLPVTPPTSPPEEQRREPAPDTGTKKGRNGQKTTPLSTKQETVEPPPPEPAASAPNPPDIKPGTWVTTTPGGQQIGTRGSEKLELEPILSFKATDPVNGTVMTTREDQVVTVQSEDGTFIVEHADGTRITTFYQNVEIPLAGDHEETGEAPQTVTRRGKFVRVESEGFATIVLNSEAGIYYSTFPDGTEVLAEPRGVYQVVPPLSGCLSIDQEGRAVYSPRTGSSTQIPSRQEVPGSYTMSHTAEVICETTDPEGNLYQVMVDGSTSVVLSGGETGEEDEYGEKESDQPGVAPGAPLEVYDLHIPRFFVVLPDGSGCELLRKREVEDYLATSYGDPETAVIQEPTLEMPGVQSVTVLKPLSEASPWIMKKHLKDLVPPNLLSRSWEAFPPVERKTPGPPLGAATWKGLCFTSNQTEKRPPPIVKNPKALTMRRLLRYETISESLREGLQRSLKRYIDEILEKEERLQETGIKDPRTTEERERAAGLLQLVLSYAESWEPSEDSSPAHAEGGSRPLVLTDHSPPQADVADRYQKAVEPTPPALPPKAKPRRSAEDWETLRREIQELKENLAALRMKDIPPYFRSEPGKAFLLAQAADAALHSRKPPPLPSERENEKDPERRITEPQTACEADNRLSVCGIAVSPGSGAESGGPERALQGGGSYPNGPEMVSPTAYRPPAPSLSVDVTGQPRKGKVLLPTSIRSAKPPSVPRAKLSLAEDPVRCSGNSLSGSAPTSRGTKRLPGGFHLFPAAVQFGVLCEGFTYATAVTVKNVGVDFSRFHVKRPSPSSGLRVTYTPGPVAAGMETKLELELFAMAVGLEGAEGEAEWSHCVELHTELESLFLPLTATVLTQKVYESRSEKELAKGRSPGVRLVSTEPNARLGVLRPTKALRTDAERLNRMFGTTRGPWNPCIKHCSVTFQ
ncbi:sperm-associated antigen 17 [Spea bombifrons]|uniref:sperm-associated antigen 17 n=1 Tax=Spea bombifrons TaxID=233779 RepID=UPI00234AE463|nr:sperm-associated antigen 17 [Spea bombifrons]